MNDTSLKCPYCHISLFTPDKSLERRQVSLRCKYCYGIFSFMPYDKRITFSKTRNYYEVFGLERNIDLVLIKKRYRELALRFHPDRHEDKEFASEKMKHINFIYSILSNQESRNEYDATMGFKEELEDLYSNYEPPFYIYQESIEISDSFGLKVTIKRNDYIYFPVAQVISMLGIRINLKQKGYVGIKVQKIFNPAYKNEYEKALKKKIAEDPLFCVNFGEEEMIIYRSDFQPEFFCEFDLKRVA